MKIVKGDAVINAIKKVLDVNDGDDSTEAILLAIGCDMLSVDEAELLHKIEGNTEPVFKGFGDKQLAEITMRYTFEPRCDHYGKRTWIVIFDKETRQYLMAGSNYMKFRNSDSFLAYMSKRSCNLAVKAIREEKILCTLKEFMVLNEGDEAMQDEIIAIGCDILGVPDFEMYKRLGYDMTVELSMIQAQALSKLLEKSGAGEYYHLVPSQEGFSFYDEIEGTYVCWTVGVRQLYDYLCRNTDGNPLESDLYGLDENEKNAMTDLFDRYGVCEEE